MKLESYEISKQLRKDTALVDFLNAVTSVLNLGRYQMRIVTAVPTWTGESGEHLLYVSGTVRRLYFYEDTNATWQYIEWNGSGQGQTSIVANVSLVDQTADLGPVTIYTPLVAGIYRVNVYALCSTAATGTLATTIGWTDAVGAKTLKPTSDVDLSNTANGSTGQAFFSSEVVAITYTTAIAGKVGTPKYDLHIVVERLL